MKKFISSAVFTAFLALSVNPLYGHGDHVHKSATTKVSESKAKEIAIKQVNNYVLDGKLDKSWKNIPVKSVKQQNYYGTQEWVFTFHNPNEPKADQKNLYVFVNQYGEMTGANFTGK